MIRKIKKKGKLIIIYRNSFSLFMGCFFLVLFLILSILSSRILWSFAFIAGIFFYYYLKLASSTTLVFNFYNRKIIWKRTLSIGERVTNALLKKNIKEEKKKKFSWAPADSNVLGADRDYILGTTKREWKLEDLEKIVLDFITIGFASRTQEVQVIYLLFKDGSRKEVFRGDFGVSTIYKWLKRELKLQIPGKINFQIDDKVRKIKIKRLLILTGIVLIIITLVLLYLYQGNL